MAAFTSQDGNDRDAFMTHWKKILADSSVVMKTIESTGGRIVGSIGSYFDGESGAPEVTYWIGKDDWGKGIASAALQLFLDIQCERPIYARVAADNVRSRRVLEKNGFRIVRQDRSFAAARGTELDEYLLVHAQPIS